MTNQNYISIHQRAFRRRKSARRHITLWMHVQAMVAAAVCVSAAFGLGIIFMSIFLFTKDEFWANVSKFFGGIF